MIYLEYSKWVCNSTRCFNDCPHHKYLSEIRSRWLSHHVFITIL